MKWLIILSIIISTQTSFAAPHGGYILFFQPLYELPTKTSQRYIVELRELLKKHSDKDLNFLLSRNYQNDICAKKGFRTCVHGLYKKHKCIPKKSNPSLSCFQQSGKSVDRHFFEESVFNRINWNGWALQMSLTCQKLGTKTCKSMSRLQKKYIKIYLTHVKDKIKKQKNKKPWDL